MPKTLHYCLPTTDRDDYALALMLRGSSYLELDFNASPNNIIAQNILKESLNYVKKRNPWLIYNNLAIAYYYEKNWSEAAKMYGKSLRADSLEFGTCMNYANLLRTEYESGYQTNIKQIDSAIYFYNKAISLNKNDKRPYLNLVFGLYDIGKNDAAEEIITKLKEMDPTDPKTYYFIAQKQDQVHINDKAIINYSLAAQFSKNVKLKGLINHKIDSLKSLTSVGRK